MTFKFRFAAIIVSTFVLASACSDDPNDVVDDSTKKDDTIGVNTFQIKGQNFMMPSPMMIADMVKRADNKFDKSLLNPTANAAKYTDAMKQALVLGIYGADLGYITMYDQTQDALEYYKTVNTIADGLKITASFDQALLSRFSNNIANKDSMMVLVGEAYRRSDNFLRESQQDHIAALILAGGWIESMHFALQTYSKNPGNKDIAVRIGEQKNTSAGLVKLLVDCEKPEFAELITLMQALDAEYQKVVIKYTFAEPAHNEGGKITTINGTTEVQITDELLKSLTEKVAAVRNYIVN